MKEIMILSVISLVIAIIIFCLYFILKLKRQATQVFTLESFLHYQHVNEDVNQKESMLNKINDYFTTKKGEADINDNSDDGGDDGGE